MHRTLALACLASLCQPLRAVQLLPPADVVADPDPSYGHLRSVSLGYDFCSDDCHQPQLGWHPETPDEAPALPCVGRPIPTPCRASSPVDLANHAWHLEVLDTLLDECASATDEWAFLAATLLDTLSSI